MIGDTMRVLEPAAGVLAFYDGRVPGVRLHGPGPNWLDDGAFVLGTASYAIVAGDEAVVYDTHMSPAHAALVRAELERRGVRRFTVVLSHWHHDHVAGNAVFADCEILALDLTADFLAANRADYEAGAPPIRPLVMPTRTFAEGSDLALGGRTLELRRFDVHSRDGLVIRLPDAGILLAGDTLEDTLTYVAEPTRLDRHLADLDRMAAWPMARILPNHGDPDRIAAGGYGTDLIDATRRYVEILKLCRSDAALAAAPVRDLLAPDLASGAILWFEPYADVHAHNLAAVLAAERTDAP